MGKNQIYHPDIYVLFNIGFDLTDLKESVGPWRRYAL